MILKKFLVLMVLGCTAVGTVQAQICFLGGNADESENFSFVALSDYAAGTVINFTDSSYGNNLPGGEERFRWTEHLSSAGAPLTLTLSSSLSAGQVIVYDDVDNRFEYQGSTYGSTSGLESDFSTSGDQLFAYTGTITDDGGTSAYRGNPSGISILGAFNWGNAGWLTSGAGSTSNSYLPTAGASFSFDNSLDNVQYTGPREFMSQAEMIAALKNIANWSQDDVAAFGADSYGDDFVINSIPEPSAIGILTSVALAGLIGRRRRS